jgi:adenylosuccinate lyase
VLLSGAQAIADSLKSMAKTYQHTAMLSRTHGQPATPTTLGKELANTVYRLQQAISNANSITILGKCNGAVGNFNAHLAAYPYVDWVDHSQAFIDSLGLATNPFTTQIEPHDWVASLCDALSRMNTLLIDFSRDTWSYISLGYFKQKLIKNEVGSSTMPHKVNPIDFENAEGNLGVANALFNYFSQKLPISRLQRDLSDSTVLRNIGVAFAHTEIAFSSLAKGISKLTIDEDAISNDLASQWLLLAEPIQTMMRRYKVSNAYEQLKDLTRGETVDKARLHQFIDSLDIPESARAKLKTLTPSNYLGLSASLVETL